MLAHAKPITQQKRISSPLPKRSPRVFLRQVRGRHAVPIACAQSTPPMTKPRIAKKLFTFICYLFSGSHVCESRSLPMKDVSAKFLAVEPVNDTTFTLYFQLFISCRVAILCVRARFFTKPSQNKTATRKSKGGFVVWYLRSKRTKRVRQLRQQLRELSWQLLRRLSWQLRERSLERRQR